MLDLQRILIYLVLIIIQNSRIKSRY